MKEEFEKYLNNLIEDGLFPGCNYAIVMKDETICGSVGYKSLIPSKVTNELGNLYDIASITKLLVTNTLVSFLVRDGKIKLDDYVQKYIDTFPFEDVKIIHLLTHSSGLRPTFNKFNLTSKDEFFYKFERDFEPGTNVKYVDINFILLGFILEDIYEESLDLVAYNLIFKPLEMSDTSYNPKDKDRCVPMELTTERGLVCGTVHDEKAAFLSGVAGHAGVFSTVSDLSKFVSMVLNDGFFNGKLFLDKIYLDTWFTPLFIGEDSVRRTVGWIYGKSSRFCKEVCGDDSIYHTGFPGHHILIDKTNDIGLIFLSNAIHPSRDIQKFRESRKDIIETTYHLLEKYHKI